MHLCAGTQLSVCASVRLCIPLSVQLHLHLLFSIFKFGSWRKIIGSECKDEAAGAVDVCVCNVHMWEWKKTGEMADIWEKEAMHITFWQERGCGFNQHDNNTGTEKRGDNGGKWMQREFECRIQREAEPYSMWRTRTEKGGREYNDNGCMGGEEWCTLVWKPLRSMSKTHPEIAQYFWNSLQKSHQLELRKEGKHKPRVTLWKSGVHVS